MKHVKTDVLLPGMVLAEDVIDRNHRLVMSKGMTLSAKAIKMLEARSIPSIRIEDPVGIEVEEIVEEEPEPVVPLSTATADSVLAALDNIDLSIFTREPQEEESVIEEPSVINTTKEPSHFDRLKSSPKFIQFQNTFQENVGELRGQINAIVEKNAPIDVDTMIGSTLSMIESQDNPYAVFDMLHNMRQFDDLTYAHSLNVALICNVFAHWLSMSEEEIKLATACGMLHDIGKLKIDDAIIKKPGKLTDEEYRQIKSHPVEGYKILLNQDINPHIKNAALMHHEKCDGSGYPLKLTSEKIDKYAKLVSIADVYDAMTSARVYRGALCPFKVIEIFENEGLHKYDITYIMTFLENVVNTYINNRVLLSDGRIGTITWINKQCLSKPLIQLEDGEFVELSKSPDLKIEQIL